jgi:hypothetical protein
MVTKVSHERVAPEDERDMANLFTSLLLIASVESCRRIVSIYVRIPQERDWFLEVRTDFLSQDRRWRQQVSTKPR